MFFGHFLPTYLPTQACWRWFGYLVSKYHNKILYYISLCYLVKSDRAWPTYLPKNLTSYMNAPKQKTKIHSAAFERTTNFLKKHKWYIHCHIRYVAHSRKYTLDQMNWFFWPIFPAKQPTVHVIHSARQTSHLYKVRGVRWFTSTSNLALIMHEIEFPNKQKRRSQTT